MENPLVVQIRQNNLSPDMAELLEKSFLPFQEQADQWMEKAKTIHVTDISQTREMKDARDARLALKDVRVAVEKKRKELKDESLRTGRAIDGVANVLEGMIEPIETHLQEQEDFAKIQEQKRIAILDADRIKLLQQYATPEDNLSPMNLGAMGEQQFNAILLGYKTAQENKIAEAKMVEDERVAKEKADAEAREQQRLENERLRAENLAKEKLLADERAKAESERKALEEKSRIEREAAATEQKRIQDTANAEAKRLKEIADTKLKAEREAKEKVEAELKAKQDAENKRIAEEEKSRKEKLASEKKALRAPDKDKLISFAKSLGTLPEIFLKSEEAQDILAEAIKRIGQLQIYIINEANSL